MAVGMSVLITVAMFVLVPIPAFEQEERNRISIKAMENIRPLILSIILTSAVIPIYTSVDKLYPILDALIHHLPLTISEYYQRILTGQTPDRVNHA